VTDKNGNPAVQIVENDRTKVVPVTVGLSDGHFTQIRSGLTAGEVVKARPALG
jgi:multidrug efflux pump subunit AcrA (membrane-fusion protein)